MRYLLAVVAMAVVLVSAPLQAAPCAGFTDVDDASGFCASVAWMKNRGITLGCTSTLYCPGDFVRRDQMAAFMYRLGFQNAFLKGGNAFGTAAQVGTTDNQPVDVIANGARVARFQYADPSPNVLLGHWSAGAYPGVHGATVAGGGSTRSDLLCTTGFGCSNGAVDHFGTVGGGESNVAGDLDGDVGNSTHATVGGGFNNAAKGNLSTVGGGFRNTASDKYGTVGGGFDNTAGLFSTVGGGYGNTASDTYSTVAGGSTNTASAPVSAVAGGYGNTASGYSSAVAGGYKNAASGDYGIVAGGERNTASGYGSFAAGVRAKAVHGRSFVWNGDANNDTFSIGEGDFVVYAPGRIRLYAGSYGTGGCEVGTVNFGGNLTCYGTITAAQFVPSSDQSMKSDIVPIDPAHVLARVVSMPISEWSFTKSPGVRHIGPMAQDFRAAFGLGDTDTGIATVDADGVALAAIQGVYKLVQQKDAEITALKREVADLRSSQQKEIADLRLAVEVAMARTSPEGRVAQTR